MEKVTSIVTLPNFDWLGSTSPAMVDRETGIIYVNASTFSSLTEPQRFFVLAHEMGHYVKQTTNEEEADRFAFEKYAQAGYPLSESINTLAKVLKFRKPEDKKRISGLLGDALEYDKNKKMKYPGLHRDFADGDYDGSGFSNWLNNVGQGVQPWAGAASQIISALNTTTNNSNSNQQYTPVQIPQNYPQNTIIAEETNYVPWILGAAGFLLISVIILVVILKK